MRNSVGILLMIIGTCFAACENKDAERGQFNNNSSGADRDQTTVVKEDTLSTSKMTTDSSTIDSSLTPR
jgi:hypothetical protein